MNRQELISWAIERHSRGKSINANKISSTIYKQILKVFGSHVQFIKATGINPLEVYKNIPKELWTKELLIEWGLKRHHEGKSLKSKRIGRDVSKAISNLFGSHYKYLEVLGLTDDYLDIKPKEYWTKDRLVAWAREKHNQGYNVLDSLEHNVATAVSELFDSRKEFIEYAGLSDSYYQGNPNKWTKDKLIEMVLDRHKQGLPVYYTSFSKGLHEIIRREVGSHRQLILEAGLDYNSIRAKPKYKKASHDKDVHSLISVKTAVLGHRFEELLGELLTDVGQSFIKYDSGFSDSEPDFIFSPDHWGDAKISVNTNTTKMRRKYLTHCKKVTIFHLIGSHGYSATLSDGTERTSIFAFLQKQSKHIQDRYIPLFLDLEQEYYKVVA